MPEVTIGMPVYNDVNFIEQSIECILKQSFQDFELIISDDCSIDGCDIICKKYCEKDSRIKYIRQEKNIGISKNMKFLLNIANTKYFMWAGDDDVLEPTFIEKLIHKLESTNNCVSVFCTFSYIDENSVQIENEQNFDYSSPNRLRRLFNFFKKPNDIFGYGIFVTSEIKNVDFPIWWWPNKNIPYNNIFPSLCFYLAKSNYAHHYDKPLFYKRVKPSLMTNYSITSKIGYKDILAYILRRFYLVCFSSKMINRSGGLFLSSVCFPVLLYRWFFLSSIKEICSAVKSKITL